MLEREPGNDGALAEHISLSVSGSKSIQVTLSNVDKKVVLDLDITRKQASFNRDESGITSFSKNFTGIQVAPYEPQKGRVNLDDSSIEIFVDDGRLVFTNQIFPKSPYKNLSLNSENGLIDKVIFEHYSSALKR